MEAEARALVEVRQAVEETEAVKEARVAEEERATLLPGIFDTTSNATVQQILKEVIIFRDVVWRLAAETMNCSQVEG